MSEYQYYEFLAIDRPLDADARATLRDISSRARITATSFTNSYQWGDFKGDPVALMEHWFDLHLYATNSGVHPLPQCRRSGPPGRFGVKRLTHR